MIATPGRLEDFLDRQLIHLSAVRVLILDEADRMLDMGFSDALNKIVSFVPKQRQTLMFSATMPPKIRELAKKILNRLENLEDADIKATVDKFSLNQLPLASLDQCDKLKASAQLVLHVSELPYTKIPSTIIPNRAISFAEVKMRTTIFP